MEVLLYLWVISGIVITIGAIFFAGYRQDISTWDRESFIKNTVILAFGWPFILPFGIIFVITIAPFYGIYRLGKYFSTTSKLQNEL